MIVVFCGAFLLQLICFCFHTFTCCMHSWLLENVDSCRNICNVGECEDGGGADRIQRVLNVSNSNRLPCRRVHNVHIVVCWRLSWLALCSWFRRRSGECPCEVLTGCHCVQCDGYEPRKDVSSRHMMYRSAARYCLAGCWFGWAGGGRVGCGCSLDGGWRLWREITKITKFVICATLWSQFCDLWFCESIVRKDDSGITGIFEIFFQIFVSSKKFS